MRILTAFSLAVAVFVTEKTFAADTNAAPLKKIAVIVENHADAALNDKVAVLEDLVTSRIAGQGFSVISRDVVLNAVGGASKLDTALSENTSALRLAQTLGVDFILLPSSPVTAKRRNLTRATASRR